VIRKNTACEFGVLKCQEENPHVNTRIVNIIRHCNMEKFDTSGAGTAYPSGAPEFNLGFFVGYNTPTT
jgi:hypothetical protein